MASTLLSRQDGGYDPHNVAGIGGSRVNSNTKLVFSPDGVGDPQCLAVLNGTDKDYFVPWRSSEEWQAFRHAAAAGTLTGDAGSAGLITTSICCLPKNVDICTTSHALGQRVAATRHEGELPGYGAEGDVYGPVHAGTNRMETWSCIEGAWVLVKQSGSCEPHPSQCGADAGATGTSTVPSALCAKGNTASIPEVVTDTDGKTFRWTWSCAGTDEPVQCATGDTSAPSACGAGNGVAQSELPYNYLCAANNLTLWSSRHFDSASNQWLWNCQGFPTDVNPPVTCSAPFNTDNGVCGPFNAQPHKTIPADATASDFCTYGEPGTLGRGSSYPIKWGGDTLWWWQCFGKNGGKDASCSMSTDGPECGPIAGTMAADMPTSTASMCSSNSRPSPISSGPGSSWAWSCMGWYGGDIACSTLPLKKANGLCGNANEAYMPYAPNRNLCEGGTATTPVGEGPWSWSCNGISGGTTATCSAKKCLACAGAIVQSFQSPVTSGAVPLGGQVCDVWGISQWTETLERTAVTAPVSIAWTDAFNGTFSKTYQPVRVGTPYCEPCYYRTTAVTGINVVVTTNSACGGAAQGAAISLPPTNVTVDGK